VTSSGAALGITGQRAGALVGEQELAIWAWGLEDKPSRAGRAGALAGRRENLGQRGGAGDRANRGQRGGAGAGLCARRTERACASVGRRANRGQRGGAGARANRRRRGLRRINTSGAHSKDPQSPAEWSLFALAEKVCLATSAANRLADVFWRYSYMSKELVSKMVSVSIALKMNIYMLFPAFPQRGRRRPFDGESASADEQNRVP
jgi:hypothetical protein